MVVTTNKNAGVHVIFLYVSDTQQNILPGVRADLFLYPNVVSINANACAPGCTSTPATCDTTLYTTWQIDKSTNIKSTAIQMACTGVALHGVSDKHDKLSNFVLRRTICLWTLGWLYAVSPVL